MGSYLPFAGLPGNLSPSADTQPPPARRRGAATVRDAGPVTCPTEDSPSGLWRSLGKRVGLTALRGSNPLSSAARQAPGLRTGGLSRVYAASSSGARLSSLR